MEATFDEMVDMFRATHQTIVTVDDFNTEIPATDVNLVIQKGDSSMIVRIGWGSMGLHADVYGFHHGNPIGVQTVEMDMCSSVYVRNF